MKSQFILYRRNGTYYCEDTKTGKQQSLRTKDEAAANALLHSKNEAYRQPILNQSIALAYLSATDPEAATPTNPASIQAKIKPFRFLFSTFKISSFDHFPHVIVTDL